MTRWLLSIGFCVSVTVAGETRAQNDPYAEQQWGIEAINLPDDVSAPESVVVAVIDSGLDYFHPDLDPSQVWRNVAELPNGEDDDGNGYVDDLIGWNFYDYDNNPWDLAGHGTHVAGIIAAQRNNRRGIAGLSSNSVIMPLKVLNFGGYGSSHMIAEAILYAVNNGADIINLSLGSEGRTGVEDFALTYAESQGVLVVVAAGNERTELSNWGPARVASTLVVAATDVQGEVSGFSNYGSVDVVAPGEGILSLRARRTDLNLMAADPVPAKGFVGPQNQYALANGTSFAAPFATGLAAILLGRTPDLTPLQLRRILRVSAADIAGPGIDQRSGYGIVDARAALKADMDDYIEARISGVRVVSTQSGQGAEVVGTADARRLERYTIQVGQGEAPNKWQTPVDPGRSKVIDDVLAVLPARVFGGTPLWTLRVVVKDRRLGEREFRYRLNLE